MLQESHWNNTWNLINIVWIDLFLSLMIKDSTWNHLTGNPSLSFFSCLLAHVSILHPTPPSMDASEPSASGLMCLQSTEVTTALHSVCSQCFLELGCYLENRSCSGGSLSFVPQCVPCKSSGKPLSEKHFSVLKQVIFLQPWQNLDISELKGTNFSVSRKTNRVGGADTLTQY